MAHQASDQIYRQEALEHFSTPEQLDQLLRIVTLKSWIPLAVIGGGILAGLAWGIFGRIPVTVEGAGILLYPQQIISFQAPASGQLTQFAIKVGDRVESGQELGRINQPELYQRLEQERVRLNELIKRDQELQAMWVERTSLEEAWISSTRQRLSARITLLRETAAARQTKSEDYFREQRANLKQLSALTDTLSKNAFDRYEHLKSLAANGLATDIEVADAQRLYFDNQMKLADVGLRKHELELKQLEAEGVLQDQLDTVADLESQLEELSVKLSRNKLTQRESAASRQLEIQESQRAIERLKRELDVKGRVVAQCDGRVLEVTAAVGQIITEGQRLGAIESAGTKGELRAIAYYGVADGKKITPGMTTRVVPTTVQRERYGSIIAQIASVSSFPVTTEAVTNTVGNAEVAHRLTSGGNKIEVVAVLEPDSASASGFQWTSGTGPDAPVSAGTTVTTHTTIEARRPISYVIPLLRRWSEAGE